MKRIYIYIYIYIFDIFSKCLLLYVACLFYMDHALSIHFLQINTLVMNLCHRLWNVVLLTIAFQNNQCKCKPTLLS